MVSCCSVVCLRFRPRFLGAGFSSLSVWFSVFGSVGSGWRSAFVSFPRSVEFWTFCCSRFSAWMGLESTHIRSSSDANAWAFCITASAVLLLLTFFFFDSLLERFSRASDVFASPLEAATLSSVTTDMLVVVLDGSPGCFSSSFARSDPAF